LRHFINHFPLLENSWAWAVKVRRDPTGPTAWKFICISAKEAPIYDINLNQTPKRLPQRPKKPSKF